MYAFLLLQADGLSWKEIVAAVPHDAPAFVIYVLIVLAGWATWRGSRARRGT
jgi:hypothetical protein